MKYVVCVIRKGGGGRIFYSKERYSTKEAARKALLEYKRRNPDGYFFVGNVYRPLCGFWERDIEFNFV